MKNNILITGGKGFIGSKIEGGKPFYGNINSYYLLRMQSSGMDGIVHLAAKSNQRKCNLDLRESINANLLGLNTVLEVALMQNMWVLFISTYQIIDNTFYGLSKLLGEEMCRLYKEKGLRVSILRLPIVYGENDNENKVVTKFINQLKQGIEPSIENDGLFYFAYIGDVINMIEREVDVMQHNCGEMHTLYDLKEGIKECLKNMQ